MVTLAEIAKKLGVSIVGSADPTIIGVTHDSREVQPGFLFVAIQGQSVNGEKFVASAVEKGAVAVLSKHLLDIDVPQINVPDIRLALGIAAAACYGNPTEHLKLVGITGTNGKTSIAYMVESVILGAGKKPGVMGTVEHRCGLKNWKAANTTPEASTIQFLAKEMLEAGATHMVMEASSHGLVLNRLAGCQFDVVAFTNLTQDHLDFHKDMGEYAVAKSLLFTREIKNNPNAAAVLNLDDAYAAEIISQIEHPFVTVSCDEKSNADFRPVAPPVYSISGIEAIIKTPQGDMEIKSPMLGIHNLNNLLVALGIVHKLGMNLKEAVVTLSGFDAVPGRLQKVVCDLGFAVLVDYAHTPDALASALNALRPVTRGRIICVFGCGGDRDPLKRSVMGEQVALHTDLAIVTSDNPRTEEPASIVEMIVPGVEKGLSPIEKDALGTAAKGYVVEVDRAAAIELAIQIAHPNDTVLIAGKGHEDYQEFHGKRIYFDDREQALGAISALKKSVVK